MKTNKQRKKRQFRLKALLIIEIIVCYMAFLNVISHARGPQNYEAVTDAPLLTASDFIGFDGGRAEQGLVFNNQTMGAAVGYQAELSLDELERILISFTVDCPPEYIGSTLYVDLYNDIANYDNPEQEYHLVLQEGLNNASTVLEPGKSAPENGQLRFFTVEPADYTLEDLQIYQEIPLPNVTTDMIAVAVVLFLGMGITAFIYFRKINSLDETKGRP